MELERLERRDPLKKFSERVAIQKTVGERHGVETSPIRRGTATSRSANKRPSTTTKSRSAAKIGSNTAANASSRGGARRSEAAVTALVSEVKDQIEEQKAVADQPEQKYALVTPVKAQDLNDDESISVKVSPIQEPENIVESSSDRR